MATTTDWQAIETEYITSQCSLRALADKYDLSETIIRERSSAGGWVSKRDQMRTKVAQETRTRLLDDAIAARVQAVDLADKIIVRYLESLKTRAPNAQDAIAASKLRLLAVGEDTERQGYRSEDWRAGVPADVVEATAEAARIVNARRGLIADEKEKPAE